MPLSEPAAGVIVEAYSVRWQEPCGNGNPRFFG